MINWAELAIEIPICALACSLIHALFEAAKAPLISIVLILSGVIVIAVCVSKLRHRGSNRKND